MARVAAVVLLATLTGGCDDGGDGGGDDTDAVVADAAPADAPTDEPDADPLAPDADPLAPDADPGAADAGPPSARVTIPAGSFFMGCAGGDPDCRFDESPGRMVTLSAYELDRHEVTQQQWAACVAMGACSKPHANYDPTVTPTAPVRDVTWAQAVAYCAFRGMRLPTEAEWERAARGDSDTRAYPWGADAPTCTLAAFAGCPGPYVVGAHPAGSSPFGVEDLAGGVRELVSDYYQSGYAGLPDSDPTGPATGAQRVMRGGSFQSDDWTLRTTTRALADPAVPYDDAGLRCARSL